MKAAKTWFERLTRQNVSAKLTRYIVMRPSIDRQYEFLLFCPSAETCQASFWAVCISIRNANVLLTKSSLRTIYSMHRNLFWYIGYIDSISIRIFCYSGPFWYTQIRCGGIRDPGDASFYSGLMGSTTIVSSHYVHSTGKAQRRHVENFLTRFESIPRVAWPRLGSRSKAPCSFPWSA